MAADPQLAPAAFNLCVLMMERRDAGGLTACRQAAKAEPRNEKYAFSLGFYLNQTGQSGEAMRFLEQYRARFGGGLDSQLLLADLYLKGGRNGEALALYRGAAATPNLPPNQRQFIESRLRALQAR